MIDADGSYLGKYRKNHIPHCAPGFWEKFYFRPGNLGYPVFKTRYADVGVYICYDRHFPEGARELGLNGAEIVFNPSATVAGLSEYLWKLEQPAHAVANAYFVGAINRVGYEDPWRIGEFYGQSYFCNPRGQIVAEASRDRDELVDGGAGPRSDPRGAERLAVLPRPAAGDLRGDCPSSSPPPADILVPQVRVVPDEVRQQPLAGGVLDHLHRHAPAPKQLLLAPERPVLADHDPRNPIEQNRPAAHGAGRERGVERAAPVHRGGLPAGPLQGIHFGVEDHAAGLLATVVPAAENAVIPDQDRADGDAAFAQALAGFV